MSIRILASPMDGFWQAFSREPAPGPPYGDRFSVELAPDQFLTLPIRPLPWSMR
jgi:hypothetical protein